MNHTSLGIVNLTGTVQNSAQLLLNRQVRSVHAAAFSPATTISNWYFKRVILLDCDRVAIKDSHASLRGEIVDDRAIVPQSLVRVAGGLERFNNLV